MNTDRRIGDGGKTRHRALPACISAFICVYLWLIALPAQAAEPLGRLFFTPEQRVKLDTARSSKTRVTLTTEKPEEAAPPAAPQPEVVTYDGIVQRSDGTTTVWLNNRPLTEKDKVTGAVVGRVRPDGRITVQGQQSGRSADLKVGQRAELLSGTVEEGYAGGRVPKPEPKPESKPEVKPVADAAASSAPAPDRAKEERDQKRDLEDAMRALRDAAGARAEAAASGAATLLPGAVPAQPAQAHERPR